MSTLIVTDLHGTLPALAAVLAHPAAHRCDEIVSLGDHVNFGPQSRAVLHVMQTAQPQGVTRLIRHVSAVAASLGLSLGDEAAWHAADSTYPWAEPLSSPEFWKQLEATLQ